MEHLKELRKQRDLLQKQVAEHLGVDRTTYVKYENGVSEPGYATLKALADFFSVSADYLLGFTDVPTADGKGPYAVSASLAKDKRSYKITTPEPISILFGLYDLDVKTFAAIADVEPSLAERLCFPSFMLPAGSVSCAKPQSAYSLLTPEQHRRIIDFFRLGDIEKLDGNTEISLRIDPDVYRKIHGPAFCPAEDEEMLNSFHRLDPEDQGQVKGFIKGLASSGKYQKADMPPAGRTG